MFIEPFEPHAKIAKDAKEKMRWASVRLFHQAEGLEEISRGLSTVTPPESGADESHSEEVPEKLAPQTIEKPLRPRLGRARCCLTGGVARRLAQPPANFYQPFRLKLCGLCVLGVRKVLNHE